MVFVGIALIIAVGLGLLVASGAGGLFGLTQAQTGNLLPLVVILLIVAATGFTKREKVSTLVTGIVLWVGIFAVALVGYAYRDDLGDVAARVFGELVPGSAAVDAERGTATFRRGRGGHFELTAEINGAKVPMIFDTGASAVVLSVADAQRAGIDTSKLDFNIPVSTANGIGRAAAIRIDEITVGGIVRRRVPAMVAEASALDSSLLGMTFLETLQSYTVTSNSLVLTD